MEFPYDAKCQTLTIHTSHAAPLNENILQHTRPVSDTATLHCTDTLLFVL